MPPYTLKNHKNEKWGRQVCSQAHAVCIVSNLRKRHMAASAVEKTTTIITLT